MLRVTMQNVRSLKHPLHSSLTLSFASFGDAFLYPFLPQHADVMEIPVVWIGVLLSINRFIRILFNPVVVRLFARYGVRPITIAASIMAIASTMGYGMGWGLLSLISFRIIWGMAFAILRISSIAYALEHQYIGVSLGIGKGIQEAGPMLALWLGPMLVNNFSVVNTFLLLATISLPSLLYALSLPDLQYIPVPGRKMIFRLPSLFNALSLFSSFIIEGLLIIVIGLLLTKNNVSFTAGDITFLAGGYLAYRRICSMLFSPLSGMIADRVGFTKVFNFSILLIIIGLVLLITGWVSIALITIFTFNSVNNAVAPGGASYKESDKVNAVSINATWRDIGSGAGTLIGGMLLSGSLVFETFVMATFMLTGLLIIHYIQTNSH
jgi:MFS transporter, DHA1 family, multidrug resistance protein